VAEQPKTQVGMVAECTPSGAVLELSRVQIATIKDLEKFLAAHREGQRNYPTDRDGSTDGK
jgi:hypothetical protein